MLLVAPAHPLPADVQLGTLGTRHWAPGSTAGRAHAPMDPAAPGTLPHPAIKTAGPGRSSATAAPGTQVGAMGVPLHCPMLCASGYRQV